MTGSFTPWIRIANTWLSTSYGRGRKLPGKSGNDFGRVSGVPTRMNRQEELRQRILELVAEYHDSAFAPRHFVPGKSPVPVAGRVFDAFELQNLVEAGLDFWL